MNCEWKVEDWNDRCNAKGVAQYGEVVLTCDCCGSRIKVRVDRPMETPCEVSQ